MTPSTLTAVTDSLGWFRMEGALEQDGEALGALAHPAVLRARALLTSWSMPVEDNGFALLKTADGKVAWLHASCTEWKNLFSFEVFGRQGTTVVVMVHRAARIAQDIGRVRVGVDNDVGRGLEPGGELLTCESGVFLLGRTHTQCVIPEG